MKKIFKSVLTLGLVAGLGFAANAQQTASAPSSAVILTDLTIALEAGSSINFGNVSATTPGTIILDANEVTNSNTGTTTGVARFNITGEDGANITVDYDATVNLIVDTVVDPGDPTAGETIVMTPEVVGDADLDNQSTATSIASATTVEIGDASNVGLFYIWVGGSLPQLTGKGTGTYSGTFNISVEYN